MPTLIQYSNAFTILEMGFGVLDDHHLEHVPGTALLEDLHSTAIQGVDASRLKHDKTGNVILVPQVRLFANWSN